MGLTDNLSISYGPRYCQITQYRRQPDETTRILLSAKIAYNAFLSEAAGRGESRRSKAEYFDDMQDNTARGPHNTITHISVLLFRLQIITSHLPPVHITLFGKRSVTNIWVIVYGRSDVHGLCTPIHLYCICWFWSPNFTRHAYVIRHRSDLVITTDKKICGVHARTV